MYKAKEDRLAQEEEFERAKRVSVAFKSSSEEVDTRINWEMY